MKGMFFVSLRLPLERKLEVVWLYGGMGKKPCCLLTCLVDLPQHYFLEHIPPLEKTYQDTTPFHLRLNNKTLTLVFYYVLHEDDNFVTALPTRGRAQTKIILSQLCHRFRYLIVRNPAFWSAFYLTVAQVEKSATLLLLTRTYMKRCNQPFMQIHVEDAYRDGKLASFGGGGIDIMSEIVLHFRNQLLYLKLSLYSDVVAENFFSQRSSDFPCLEALDITLWESQRSRQSGYLTESPQHQIQACSALANIPTLRFLKINSRNRPRPFNLQVTWRTLYVLDLNGTPLSYRHFQRILADCHLLSTAVFDVQIAPAYETDIRSFGRLVHPNIRNLTLTLLNPSNDRRLFDLVFFPHPYPHEQHDRSVQFWFPLLSFPFLHSLTIRLYDKLEGWNFNFITKFIQLSANAANLTICRLQDVDGGYSLLEPAQKSQAARQQSAISTDDLINLNKVIPQVRELHLPNSTPVSRAFLGCLGAGEIFIHAQVIKAATLYPLEAWSMVYRRCLVASSRAHVKTVPLRYCILAVPYMFKDSIHLQEWADKTYIIIEYMYPRCL